MVFGDGSAEELLRLVSHPERDKDLDKICGFPVYAVLDFYNAELLVDLRNYETVWQGDMEVYRLKDKFHSNSYRLAQPHVRRKDE